MHYKNDDELVKTYPKNNAGLRNIVGIKRSGMRSRTLLIALVSIFAAATALIFSSCSTNNVNTENGKITVYTSFYTMYDFTTKIGKDKVNVINMVPSGMEPHDWEPAPKDITGLAKADLFIYNGAGMEGWVEKVLGSISNYNLVAVETSKEITLEKTNHTHQHDDETTNLTDHSHGNVEYDPHVWLNPMNAKIQMKAIKDGLVQVDPENKEYYEENFKFYALKLDELDRKYREAAASFSRKEIVVSHEAYGYLCSAYGLEQIALDGISSDSETTAKKMKEIIDFIDAHDVKAVFYDGLSSPKVVNTIAEHTGIRTAVLNPLEGISEQDLQAGKDYFSVMEENLKALSDALQ